MISNNLSLICDDIVLGCEISGNFYGIGEVVKPASGPCLECKCDESGMMQCNPQDCSPQAPLLLRMNKQFFDGSSRRWWKMKPKVVSS